MERTKTNTKINYNTNAKRHKPYINKSGVIVFDKTHPPTEDELRPLKLKLFISGEMDFNTKILSILKNDGDSFIDTIRSVSDRIQCLVQARMELIQNEPVSKIENAIGTHYSAFLHQYI